MKWSWTVNSDKKKTEPEAPVEKPLPIIHTVQHGGNGEVQRITVNVGRLSVTFTSGGATVERGIVSAQASYLVNLIRITPEAEPTYFYSLYEGDKAK